MSVVIGVDEVGRGCLAGPVYAAAVCFKEPEIVYQNTNPPLFKDSKLISASKREQLASVVRDVSYFGVGIASVEEINTLNILKASLLAMKRAIEGLGLSTGTVFVDGQFKIPNLLSALRQVTVTKGESQHQEIAAASILAKVIRDQKLKELSLQYPNYLLEKHKGYGTREHREAIQKWGPSSIHRRDFKGVKEFFTKA